MKFFSKLCVPLWITLNLTIESSSLVQAQLGTLSVQDFGLSQDIGKIFRSTVRISRCKNCSILFRFLRVSFHGEEISTRAIVLWYQVNTISGLLEVHWHRPYFKTLMNAVLLAKCCKAKLWENSKHVSRQLTGIG